VGGHDLPQLLVLHLQELQEGGDGDLGGNHLLVAHGDQGDDDFLAGLGVQLVSVVVQQLDEIGREEFQTVLVVFDHAAQENDHFDETFVAAGRVLLYSREFFLDNVVTLNSSMIRRISGM
jgi:hypothetical protein